MLPDVQSLAWLAAAVGSLFEKVKDIHPRYIEDQKVQTSYHLRLETCLLPFWLVCRQAS
jgi:hypothetical protein